MSTRSISSTDTYTEDSGSLSSTHRDILFENLKNGFASLVRSNADRGSSGFPAGGSDSADGGSAATTSINEKNEPFITVNFIDPSSGGGVVAIKSSETSAASKYASHRHIQAPLELYEKLTATFERDFGSTLHSVPYQNIRTGSHAVVERLPIRPVLTRSHISGVGAANGGDAMVPWGGTAGSAAAPVSDPAEWHNGPYCHVYIAACESAQHYRTKVRPALQAFVSQIEGAANNAHPMAPDSAYPTNNSAHSGTPASGNYSAHYIIVFVPTGRTKGAGQDVSIESASPANRMGAALASRMAAAKKRMANAAAAAQRDTNAVSGDSVHSVASNDEQAYLDDISEASYSSNDITISKQDRELYRKFAADFPNATTCILSTLLDQDNHPLTDSTENTSQTQTTGGTSSGNKYSPQRTQEWNLFTRALGSAIVDGFRDRCRRYHEELRRLDSHRAGIQLPNSKNKTTTPFDLTHFFLVKESLAFTYEQMQLPAEALLQYEELRAFVPDATEANSFNDTGSDQRAVSTRQKNKQLSIQDGQSAMGLAVAGDIHGFRRRIRGVTDLVPLAHIVITYLFAREISLLFKMGQPVEIMKRCQIYIETIYSFMFNANKTTRQQPHFDEDTLKGWLNAEEWALSFCWDVKCAIQPCFPLLGEWMESVSVDTLPESSNASFRRRAVPGPSTPAKRDSILNVSTDPAGANAKALSTEQALARQLSEILEFGRLRLIRIGDIHLGVEKNPFRMIQAAKGGPVDLKKPWSPWSADIPTSTSDETESSFSMFSAMQETRRPFIMDADPDDEEKTHFPESPQDFLSKYMELTSAIATVGFFAGRHRHGARLQGEIADILIQRDDYQSAIKALLPTVSVLAKDHWHRCHFWHLFRLASCQRRVGEPVEYLTTLVNCFGPNILPVAPKKALNFLLTDLEDVANHLYTLEKGSRFSMVPFIGTRLEIEKTSSGESSTVIGAERKQLLKKLCMVGDDVRLNLHVSSFLPQAIEIDSITVSLVTFDSYTQKIEENKTLTKEDIYKELLFTKTNLPGSTDDATESTDDEMTTLDPGLNKFIFDWVAVKPGNYILASVEIKWKNISFYFDAIEYRRPLVGIDVIPSDPTQSIKLEPFYLVPGHVQPIRIIYQSGADFVENGSVRLSCTQGLEIIPPGKEQDDANWKSSCEVKLPPCKPGETTVLDAIAKASTTSSILRAEIATNYRHAKIVGKYDNYARSNSDAFIENSMKTVLEVTVPTLDKPILSVIGTQASLYNINNTDYNTAAAAVAATNATTTTLSGDKVLVNVSLLCNAPYPFTINSWELLVPLPLCIDATGGDLNSHDLFQAPILEGEELSFSFDCNVVTSTETEEKKDGSNKDDENKEEEKDEKDDESELQEQPCIKIQFEDEYGTVFDEKLPLKDLEPFYAQLRRRIQQCNGNIMNGSELSNLSNDADSTVTIELKNYLTEGVVGSPVILTYIIDTHSLIKVKDKILSASAKSSYKFLYTVDYDGRDWIVGGNIQGSVSDFDTDGTQTIAEDKEFCIELIAIPAREGIIKGFPTLCLSYTTGRRGGESIGNGSSSDEHYFDIINNTPIIPINVQMTKQPEIFHSLAFMDHTAVACPTSGFQRK